jgi:hypothetical protein
MSAELRSTACDRHWQKCRREFSHDWLKNQYIVALNSWLRLLDGEIDDPLLEHSFLEEVLPRWEVRSPEVRTLIESFPREMSPRQLFDEPPLSRCDAQTTAWLGEMIHGLWLVRCSVESLTVVASASLEAANLAYEELSRALATRREGDVLHRAIPLRGLFERFRNDCQKLGAALSEFPHEIQVV